MSDTMSGGTETASAGPMSSHGISGIRVAFHAFSIALLSEDRWPSGKGVGDYVHEMPDWLYLQSSILTISFPKGRQCHPNVGRERHPPYLIQL